MKRMFGIIGAPHSGKDYVAQLLREELNADTIAFADVVKEKYFGSVGITGDDFDGFKKKDAEKEDAVRKGMWAYSDAVKKIHGDDYFTKITMGRAKEFEDIVVFSDVRIKTEMYFMDSLHKSNDMPIKYIFVHSGGDDFHDVKGHDTLKGSRLVRSDIWRHRDHYTNDKVIDIVNDAYLEYKLHAVIEQLKQEGFFNGNT